MRADSLSVVAVLQQEPMNPNTLRFRLFIHFQLNIKLHSWILSDLQQLKLAMDDL